MAEESIAHKVCADCKASKPLDAFGSHKRKPDGKNIYCRDCQRQRSHNQYHGDIEKSREYHKEHYHRWRLAHPEKFKAAQAKYRAGAGRESFLERERQRAQQPSEKDRKKRHKRLMRLEVLEAYGGYCQCCGETEYEFLAIDHIEGNGNAHRREIGATGGGYRFYKWLIENSFPPGFQVLCHNCNMAKGFYGECPHVRMGGELFKAA